MNNQSCFTGCPDRRVSFCSSHQNVIRLHCSLSAEPVCVAHSSSPMGSALWNRFQHIGHFHVMRECYLDLVTPSFIKAKWGKKEDRYTPWYAIHNFNCTQESFSLSCNTGDEGHSLVTGTHLFCNFTRISKWRGANKQIQEIMWIMLDLMVITELGEQPLQGVDWQRL